MVALLGQCGVRHDGLVCLARTYHHRSLSSLLSSERRQCRLSCTPCRSRKDRKPRFCSSVTCRQIVLRQDTLSHDEISVRRRRSFEQRPHRDPGDQTNCSAVATEVLSSLPVVHLTALKLPLLLLSVSWLFLRRATCFFAVEASGVQRAKCTSG